MMFEQFYLESLGHASYLVGDEATGCALVVDPRRDVDVYLDCARIHGLRIAYAMDTHGHADYVSGLSELRRRQDMEILGYAGAELGYDHLAVHDGQVIEMGDVAFEIMHTPGHTPEHVSLLVYHRASGSQPVLLLSGGALLVGDVGRPYALGTPEEIRDATQATGRTLNKLLGRLGDDVAVYPTHVRGSLSGSRCRGRLWSTIGAERRSNSTLAAITGGSPSAEQLLLGGLPAVPPYCRRLRSQNLSGPPVQDLWEPPALVPGEFARHRDAGAIVLDARSPEDFAGGHIPGALNVGLGPSFATWAGTVVPDRARVLLVLDRPADLWEASWQLLRVGYGLPEGWLAGGMAGWARSGGDLGLLPVMDVHELRARLSADAVHVLDVRQPGEWSAGHIPDATFITGAELPGRLAELPGRKPLAVVCATGYRSSVAASVIAREGRSHVFNVAGGMSAWTTSGYPVEPRREAA